MLDAVELVGWAGALLTLTAYSMKTMLPLRMAGISANVFFVAYGALAPVYPTLVLHALLLPFNVFRLWQILALTRRLATARAHDEEDFSILHAYGRTVEMADGTRVFRRGDSPDSLYFILEGEVYLEEIDRMLGPGGVFGEMAFFTDAKQRTASAVCCGACRICAVSEADFMKLYFQHPAFGMAILKLIVRRLSEGMSKPLPDVLPVPPPAEV